MLREKSFDGKIMLLSSFPSIILNISSFFINSREYQWSSLISHLNHLGTGIYEKNTLRLDVVEIKF